MRSFVDATSKTLESYLGNPPVIGTPLMSKDLVIGGDIAGVVDFRSHDVEGAMVIVFEKTPILNLYKSLIGEEVSEINGDVQDCVGEIANTIYGMAKAPLVDAGYLFPMARPRVVKDVNSIFHATKSLALPISILGHPGVSLVLVVRRLIEAAA